MPYCSIPLTSFIFIHHHVNMIVSQLGTPSASSHILSFVAFPPSLPSPIGPSDVSGHDTSSQGTWAGQHRSTLLVSDGRTKTQSLSEPQSAVIEVASEHIAPNSKMMLAVCS